jgi:hypothetical protein
MSWSESFAAVAHGLLGALLGKACTLDVDLARPARKSPR